MSIRLRTLLVLAPLVLPFTAGRAHAAPVWTATGNSCVVDNSDLDQYEQDSFSLQHRKRAEGTILARCNVSNPLDSGANPGWGTLEVVYRDPDGRDNRSQVRVRLIRVNNGATRRTSPSSTATSSRKRRTPRRSRSSFRMRSTSTPGRITWSCGSAGRAPAPRTIPRSSW